MKHGALNLLILILLSHCIMAQQYNQVGSPLVTNYSPKTYQAGEQNWAVVQDHRGVMYFANNDDGVLEYDGVTWRKIPIPNQSIVRSLAINDLGMIYVGAVGDFGYLEPDNIGQLKYNSLIDQIDTTKRNIADVWKIWTIGDYVYFCEYKKIHIFNKTEYVKTVNLSKGGFLSFEAYGNIYVGDGYLGLHKLLKDSTLIIRNGDFFSKVRDVFMIEPFPNNKLLIGTIQEGLFLYDTVSSEIKYLSESENGEKTNNFLIDNKLYAGTQLPNHHYALGTLFGGCMIIDTSAFAKQLINKNNGLQDQTVTSVYYNNQSKNYQPIWLSLNLGISSVEFFSPIRVFKEESGIKGIIVDVVEFEGNLYVGTTVGVFVQDFDQNGLPFFKAIKNIETQVWTLEIIYDVQKEKNILLATTIEDIYMISGDLATSLNTNYYSYDIFAPKQNTEIMYLAYSKGVRTMTNKNGAWKYEKIEGVNEEIRSLAMDADGTLWMETPINGVYAYFAEKGIVHYDTANGLPAMNNVKINVIDNQVVFSSQKGLYTFEEKTQTFIPFAEFGENYTNGARNVEMVWEGINRTWMICKENDNEWIELLRQQNGQWQVDSLPFRRILATNILKIYDQNDRYSWFATSDGLYSFDHGLKKVYNQEYLSLIRSVVISEDSLVFNGTFFRTEVFGDDTIHIITNNQNKEQELTLSYKNNSLTISYAAPFFESEKNNYYSYYLEGYDDRWSKWKPENKATFTNLKEGSYVFRVKAKNVYGIDSKIAEYRFTILPPWYRTILAYVIYAVFAIIFVMVVVKLWTRKLERDKKRLEEIVKQRTVEVIKQKDEIEEKNKVIEKKNENITASIRYAQRIQNAIMPSEEYIKEIMPDSFVLFKPKDIVSGDFYWMAKKDDTLMFSAVDCTGHGVPGAFMSIVGSNWLNRALNEENLTKPSEVLNYLSKGVFKTLRMQNEEAKVKDGMDLALCSVNLKEKKLAFAGAYNPLFLYRKNVDVMQFKADVFPIGAPFTEKFQTFTNHEFDLELGDTLYVFSDGYVDQFGGPKKKKFMKKRFREMIEAMQEKPMQEQKEILDATIEEWKKEGEMEQIDDILVIGVRFSAFV